MRAAFSADSPVRRSPPRKALRELNPMSLLGEGKIRSCFALASSNSGSPSEPSQRKSDVCLTSANSDTQTLRSCSRKSSLKSPRGWTGFTLRAIPLSSAVSLLATTRALGDWRKVDSVERGSAQEKGSCYETIREKGSCYEGIR